MNGAGVGVLHPDAMDVAGDDVLDGGELDGEFDGRANCSSGHCTEGGRLHKRVVPILL